MKKRRKKDGKPPLFFDIKIDFESSILALFENLALELHVCSIWPKIELILTPKVETE